MPMGPMSSGRGDDRVRRWAIALSLLISLALLAVKFQAYRLTGSTAILSDALESIVNVVAAIFALGALVFAGRPADRNHPYGHGKMEFLSAAFEGGLIAFAAVLIVYEVVQALLYGVYLVRTGRRYDSITLVADGRHVMADFYTSAGIGVGLLLVRVTGFGWLDPLVAAVVALNLLWTGLRLVRQAAAGLLDEEDPALLGRLVDALQPHLGEGVIRVHHLRAIRAGRVHHVDAHLVVPEFWSVERSHELAEQLGERVMKDLGVEGEMTLHTDPCHRIYCRMCDLEDCPIRRDLFLGRPPLTLDEAVQPDMPRGRP